MNGEVRNFPGGVWPVMLTPFCPNGEVDFTGLEKLTDWYIDNGSSGLFAVCQSSEMFHLSLEERLQVAETVVKTAAGRVPVIACGNLSEKTEDQVKEVSRMAETGVDAVVLITNRFAAEDEDDEIWMERCRGFLKEIPADIPLGFYECPYPYKRLMSLENLKECKETGRFFFLKDTCCDMELIEKRLEVLKGSAFKLYNANTATLLDSLRSGAVGFSGVMANFHPALYAYLCEHSKEERAGLLQDFLSMAALIERQYYPVNAKYHLQQFEGLPIDTFCRKMDNKGMNETFKKEVAMLAELASVFSKHYTG